MLLPIDTARRVMVAPRVPSIQHELSPLTVVAFIFLFRNALHHLPTRRSSIASSPVLRPLMWMPTVIVCIVPIAEIRYS